MGTELTEYPPLFDGRGTFTPYPQDVLDSLSPQRRELYQNVADAAAASKQADAELQAATDTVRDCMDAVREAEKATAAGRMDFMTLWRQTFGKPRHVTE